MGSKTFQETIRKKTLLPYNSLKELLTIYYFSADLNNGLLDNILNIYLKMAKILKNTWIVIFVYLYVHCCTKFSFISNFS